MKGSSQFAPVGFLWLRCHQIQKFGPIICEMFAWRRLTDVWLVAIELCSKIRLSGPMLRLVGVFFWGGPVVPSSGSLVNLVAGGETRFSFRVDCYAPHGSPWTCKIRATVDTERFDILLIGPTEKFIFWSIESEKERDIEVVLLSMLWLTIAGTAYPRACTLAASSPISFKYQWHGAMNYLL